MKAHTNKSFVLLTLILVPMPSLIANAQTGTQRDVVIETNRQEMDALLLRKPILGTNDVSVRMALLKQLGEDFRKLQLVNNKVMKEGASELVDYKKIASLLAEIGSTASRLKANLALPEGETKKEKPAQLEIREPNQFQAELSKLDNTIVSFAHNPIFQKMNVVDVQLAHRASKELATIIKESVALKKAAAKLDKLRKVNER